MHAIDNRRFSAFPFPAVYSLSFFPFSSSFLLFSGHLFCLLNNTPITWGFFRLSSCLIKLKNPNSNISIVLLLFFLVIICPFPSFLWLLQNEKIYLFAFFSKKLWEYLQCKTRKTCKCPDIGEFKTTEKYCITIHVQNTRICISKHSEGVLVGLVCSLS